MNFLNGLDKRKLKELWISNNNFSVSDLTPFSKFVNLEELYLGNTYQPNISQNIFNRFTGSLKPLQSLTKLKALGINNTDIDNGLEYLPESVETFYCLADKRPHARVQVIANLFPNERGIVETGGNGYIINFPQKLQSIKNKAKVQARNLLDDELTELKGKITELEVSLKTERETNRASAEAMDNFYRQNPPSESLRLQNILSEISVDYLKANNENQQNKQAIKELEKTIEINDQIVEQEVRTQIENDKSQNKIKELEARIEELKAIRNTRKKETTDLQKQLNNIQKELETLRQEKGTLQEQVVRLESELVVKNKETKKTFDEIQEKHEKQLTEKDQQISELQQQLGKFRQWGLEVMEQREKDKQFNQKLQEELAKKEVDIRKELQAKIEVLRKETKW